RGGTGFHTWPHAEVVEIVGDEVVWTALGWRGTVLVRLRTGQQGRIEPGVCPTCGRTTPRLFIGPPLPAFALGLNAAPELAGWQAELRMFEGDEELIVFVAAAAGVKTGDLEARLRAIDEEHAVTQCVVLERDALAERLDAANNVRIVDQRG